MALHKDEQKYDKHANWLMAALICAEYPLYEYYLLG